jgi:predicted alpha/beta superfamily hydrolase
MNDLLSITLLRPIHLVRPAKRRYCPLTCGYFLLSLILLSGRLAAQNSSEPPPKQVMAAEVTIPNTQSIIIHSPIDNQDYVLNINLPSGYEKSTAAYPVLYVLDGQWDFPLLSAIYGEQYFDGFIPGVITVGITWGGNDPNYDKLRARDFTPSSPDGSANWGNAAKFLAVIREELIPMIDAAFRTVKTDRTLMGSSLGGLFTLYTLFNATELFSRYVLTSPAFQWDNSNLFNYEKEYAQKRSTIPVRLFMGIGGLEPGVPAFESQLVSHLKGAKYKGLQMETLVMENTGHSGTKAEGYTRGLQWAFARPSIAFVPAVLDPYTGTYASTSDTIRISREKDHLVASAHGRQFILNAESLDDYYVKGIFAKLHFRKPNDGKIEGVELHLFSNDEYLKKIMP